jgi:hypothetical protein
MSCKGYFFYDNMGISKDFEEDLGNSQDESGHPFAIDSMGHIIREPYPGYRKRLVPMSSEYVLVHWIEAPIIPSIFHYLANGPGDPIISQWQRLLHRPWQVYIWQPEDIFSISNKWYNLYLESSDPILQRIALMISVLSEYGGIIVDTTIRPWRIIPPEMLRGNLITGFREHFALDYHFMGAPINSPTVQSIYRLLCGGYSLKKERIDDTILIDPGTNLYPTYFFGETSGIPAYFAGQKVFQSIAEHIPPVPQ